MLQTHKGMLRELLQASNSNAQKIFCFANTCSHTWALIDEGGQRVYESSFKLIEVAAARECIAAALQPVKAILVQTHKALCALSDAPRKIFEALGAPRKIRIWTALGTQRFAFCIQCQRLATI
jgi:hypothetical protein